MNKAKTNLRASNKWKDIIIDNLGGYKHPVVLNAQSLKDIELKDTNVYVYVDFLKPGRFLYTIQSKQ